MKFVCNVADLANFQDGAGVCGCSSVTPNFVCVYIISDPCRSQNKAEVSRHYWTSNLWYKILCHLALIGSNPCSQFYWKSWVTCTGFPRCLPGESIIVAGANKAVGWWSWRFPWGIYCFPTSAWVVPKIVGEAKMSNTRTRNWGSLGTLQPPDAFINGNIESLQQGANHWFEQD